MRYLKFNKRHFNHVIFEKVQREKGTRERVGLLLWQLCRPPPPRGLWFSASFASSACVHVCVEKGLLSPSFSLPP